MKVGDVVQIHDEGSRLGWLLAVIEELITGEDGLIRAASIRTSTGQTNQPIIKLYPLEMVSAETTTRLTLHDHENTPDDTQEENLTVTQKQPPRHATERAKCRMTDWIKAIHAPPTPGGCRKR